MTVSSPASPAVSSICAAAAAGSTWRSTGRRPRAGSRPRLNPPPPSAAGSALPGLIHPSAVGPAACTGGAFGPDAGLVTVGAALLALAVRKDRTTTPGVAAPPGDPVRSTRTSAQWA